MNIHTLLDTELRKSQEDLTPPSAQQTMCAGVHHTGDVRAMINQKILYLPLTVCLGPVSNHQSPSGDGEGEVHLGDQWPFDF